MDGLPRALQTDQGSNFTSKPFAWGYEVAWSEAWKIQPLSPRLTGGIRIVSPVTEVHVEEILFR